MRAFSQKMLPELRFRHSASGATKFAPAWYSRFPAKSAVVLGLKMWPRRHFSAPPGFFRHWAAPKRKWGRQAVANEFATADPWSASSGSKNGNRKRTLLKKSAFCGSQFWNRGGGGGVFQIVELSLVFVGSAALAPLLGAAASSIFAISDPNFADPRFWNRRTTPVIFF